MKHVLEVAADRMEDKARKKMALEIARAMKDKGMDVNTISELTKLTIDDVLRL